MIGQDIVLAGVGMRFGATVALEDVDLAVRGGEFFSLLGPSGCGKSTILRLVSGFVEPTAGTVRIGGRDMRGLGPNRRPTALIFQSLALFPLMTVAENVAFGLEARGVGRDVRAARVRDLLALVDMPDAGRRRVSELSGGQRQRVAIARALAVEPAVLLLDEPLSALDLKLRQHMRAELRALQRRTGVTFLYITHDQGEALTMSDRVAVMSRGRIEQVGDPRSLYEDPASEFVAGFVGATNRLPGTVAEAGEGFALVDTGAGRLRVRNPRRVPAGAAAAVHVRPERLVPDGAGPNRLAGRVVRVDFEGPVQQVVLETGHGAPILVHMPAVGVPPAPGTPLDLAFEPADGLVLPVAADG